MLHRIYMRKEKNNLIQVKLQKGILVDGTPQHPLRVAETAPSSRWGLQLLLLLLLLFWFKRMLSFYGYKSGTGSSLSRGMDEGLQLMNCLFSPPFWHPLCAPL